MCSYCTLYVAIIGFFVRIYKLLIIIQLYNASHHAVVMCYYRSYMWLQDAVMHVYVMHVHALHILIVDTFCMLLKEITCFCPFLATCMLLDDHCSHTVAYLGGVLWVL